MVSALTTARARIELVKTLHKLTRNGYLPLYTDTDSVLVVKVDVRAPRLEKVVPITKKIGDFKIEKSGIEKFVGLQSKLYAYQIKEELHCRAKGFSSVKAILEANGKTDYFEEELQSFFLLEGANKGSIFHQPRMQVQHHQVRDLPEEKAKKCMRMQGPKRCFSYKLVESDSSITEVPMTVEDMDEEPKILRIDPERRDSQPLPCQQNRIEAHKINDALAYAAKVGKMKKLQEKLDQHPTKMKKVIKFPPIIPTYPVGFQFDEELELTPVEKLLGYDRLKK